ncbi:hypothetical protein [Sphingomonas profundi]|uniref:hypothetical protein n=1 Tax=Alterirhizorhabdus profundi TaxID=2681549 RepID=UPI0012E76469|nr:hypothetical protein [Sphingomonas profundi]
MAKPPPSGPHSDLTGVNRDARVNAPARDPKLGTAEEIDAADTQSKGHPDQDEAAKG